MMLNLKHKHLANCQVLPCRTSLLHVLPKNAIVAEIGVFAGDYAERIFKITSPQKLYLIDYWPQEQAIYETKQRFKTEDIDSGRISLIQEFSLIALEQFESKFFDWVYLDTDHSYQNTYNELCALKFKIKPNGFIAGHDYCNGNVEKAAKFGVIEAVNQFCIEHNWEMIYITLDSGGHFSYCIKAS